MKGTALLVLLLIGCATSKGVIIGEVSSLSAPLAGVPVVLRHRELRIETTTDARGRFEARNLGPGYYRVEAIVDAGVLAPNTSNVELVELPPNAIRGTSIKIVSVDQGALISGVVRDQFDRPVRASVCPDSSLARCVDTDSTGQFVVPWVPLGEVRLSAHQGGYANRPGPPVLARAGDRDVTLRMKYQPALAGRVVDTEGKPVSEFNVGESHFSGSGFLLRKWCRDQPLEVAARGFATEFVPLPSRGPTGDLEFPKIVLTRGELVRGSVVDAVTGKPVDGALVIRPGSRHRVLNHRGPGCGNCYVGWRKSQLPESTTDGAGRFELRLSPTQREVLVLAQGYRDATVQRSGSGELTVRLERGAVIEGVLLDREGRPLAKRAIATKPASIQVTTDRRGAFTISGLEPGAYWVGELGVGAEVVVADGERKSVVLQEPGGAEFLVLSPRGGESLFTLSPGEQPLPGQADLAAFLSASHRASPFVPNNFFGVEPGRFTLVAWTVRDEKLVLERKVVVVKPPHASTTWEDVESREYVKAQEIMQLLPARSTPED